MRRKAIYEYYTAAGVAIDNRLQAGKTKYFENLIAANAFAFESRSYTYQVFDSKRKHCGYAVPK